MRKLTEKDAETKSPDIVAENVERLKEIFPEAFTEGKIDFEVLKQLLGGAIDEREEKYGLNWHGKRRARQDLEKNEAVKLYAKLPGWFKVPTPLGVYNPDWAVLIEQDGAERLYLVVETKGSLFKDNLRSTEGAKIECGKAHFKALAVGDNPARYRVLRTLDDLLPTENFTPSAATKPEET